MTKRAKVIFVVVLVLVLYLVFSARVLVSGLDGSGQTTQTQRTLHTIAVVVALPGIYVDYLITSLWSHLK
jgi:uncharacterized membrane protein